MQTHNPSDTKPSLKHFTQPSLVLTADTIQVYYIFICDNVDHIHIFNFFTFLGFIRSYFISCYIHTSAESWLAKVSELNAVDSCGFNLSTRDDISSTNTN